MFESPKEPRLRGGRQPGSYLGLYIVPEEPVRGLLGGCQDSCIVVGYCPNIGLLYQMQGCLHEVAEY